eukprot:TRINITY_DN1132_c0_g1_i1.p3 TRINITY_DN1132_c0_g1~~TRINITY_DN1132_c0_g1_i1.p3  ORF type:complete len:60 (+),score=6.02 TRINITY_DN1132_c0_g1_i1:46-225(+)
MNGENKKPFDILAMSMGLGGQFCDGLGVWQHGHKSDKLCSCFSSACRPCSKTSSQNFED